MCVSVCVYVCAQVSRRDNAGEGYLLVIWCAGVYVCGLKGGGRMRLGASGTGARARLVSRNYYVLSPVGLD